MYHLFDIYPDSLFICNMNKLVLFAIPSLIWGSTWYVITFQLGVVHPILSVSYRFLLAGLFLMLYCLATKRNLNYSLKQHGLFLLLGVFLFGLNYLMVYTAEQTLESGLVSVVFSLIIFSNIFLNRLFLKGEIKKKVLGGATLGFTGTIVIFHNELLKFNVSDAKFFALMLCLGSILMASSGNIVSAYNQKQGLPVVQTNAFGMLYGGAVLLVLSQIFGIPLSFDASFSYVSSLLYLSVFGSVIAFTTYLNLLGKIGPDKAAYTILVIPLIAMLFSTLFEGYEWKLSAVFGFVLVILGNAIVLTKKKI